MILSKDAFYKSVFDIKYTLLQNGLSKISADNLDKLFNYFEVEYPKLCDVDSSIRTNDRVNQFGKLKLFSISLFLFRNEHDDNR